MNASIHMHDDKPDIPKGSSLFLSIDFDEGVASSYRSVTLSLRGGTIVFRSETGHPPSDWRIAQTKARETAIERGCRLMTTSSLDHFLHDVPGWRMIEDEDGLEQIVVDERDFSEDA